MPPAPPEGPVLVVEDDPALAELIGTYLRAAGYRTTHAGSVATAMMAVSTDRPALVLLDVGLPDGEGTEVLRRLRAAGDDTAVLFLTARDDELSRVLGLELGADDYVTKPFSPHELMARVRAVLRRTAVATAGGRPPDPAPTTLRLGPLTLDGDSRRVTAGGTEVHLSATEFDLLQHLLRRPGKVHTREELLHAVWGYPDGIPTRTVDVHVSQLRGKLGRHVHLRTVRAVGYAVEAVPSP